MTHYIHINFVNAAISCYFPICSSKASLIYGQTFALLFSVRWTFVFSFWEKG